MPSSKIRDHLVIHVIAQPGVQEGNALLAIKYSEISSEVLRTDKAFAGKRRQLKTTATIRAAGRTSQKRCAATRAQMSVRVKVI